MIIDFIKPNTYYIPKKRKFLWEKNNFRTLHNIDFLNNDVKGKKFFSVSNTYIYLRKPHFPNIKDRYFP